MLISECSDYKTVIEQAKKKIVVPVHLAEHKELLNHTKLLLEKEYISINQIFIKTITILCIATSNKYRIDKEATS